jgi:hypothetical protein
MAMRWRQCNRLIIAGLDCGIGRLFGSYLEPYATWHRELTPVINQEGASSSF